MNFVLKTRNCVLKTRNFVFKTMNFADCPTCTIPIKLDSPRIGAWKDANDVVARSMHGEISLFRIWNVPTAGQVSFQWKNPDFLLRNPDFLIRILISY